VLASHAPDSVRQGFLFDVARIDAQAKSGGRWAPSSDAGATTTTAVPRGDLFALHGLKQLARNANSGLAVATGRPEGARPDAGLGLCLVPSHLENGRPRHYRNRRLKDKLDVAIALLCEAAARAQAGGSHSQAGSARRYLEEIASGEFGHEDEGAREGRRGLLQEESAELAQAAHRD